MREEVGGGIDADRDLPSLFSLPPSIVRLVMEEIGGDDLGRVETNTTGVLLWPSVIGEIGENGAIAAEEEAD